MHRISIIAPPFFGGKPRCHPAPPGHRCCGSPQGDAQRVGAGASFLTARNVVTSMPRVIYHVFRTIFGVFKGLPCFFAHGHHSIIKKGVSLGVSESRSLGQFNGKGHKGTFLEVHIQIPCWSNFDGFLLLIWRNPDVMFSYIICIYFGILF